MEARAKLFGHPIHQVLIVFPLGLLSTAVIFDVIHLVTGNARWADVGYWMIAAGIVGGLAAALFGLVDWLGIPARTRAKRVGLLHGVGNVGVVALFAASWLARRDNPAQPETMALVFSFAGGGLAMITGWLGGELVSRMGIGVSEGANVNAPSSLSGRPATSGIEIFSIREAAGGSNEIEYGDRLPLVPDHTLVAGGTVVLGGLSLGIAAQYVGRRWLRGDEANEETALPRYATTGLRLGYDTEKWQVRAFVTNLFDRAYASFGTFNINQGGGGVLERFLTPGDPRRLGLMIQRRFASRSGG